MSGAASLSQDGGVLGDFEPGSRIRNALGGDGGPDVGQSGGPLQDFEPGSRVRSLLGGDGPDVGQDGELEIPDNPGPTMLGRTPAAGSLRRSRGAPVLRDNVPSVMGQ